jgi:hypothetical protein
VEYILRRMSHCGCCSFAPTQQLTAPNQHRINTSQHRVLTTPNHLHRAPSSNMQPPRYTAAASHQQHSSLTHRSTCTRAAAAAPTPNHRTAAASYQQRSSFAPPKLCTTAQHSSPNCSIQLPRPPCAVRQQRKPRRATGRQHSSTAQQQPLPRTTPNHLHPTPSSAMRCATATQAPLRDGTAAQQHRTAAAAHQQHSSLTHRSTCTAAAAAAPTPNHLHPTFAPP